MKYFRRIGFGLYCGLVTVWIFHGVTLLEAFFHEPTSLDVAINHRITIALAFTVSFLVTLLGD